MTHRYRAPSSRKPSIQLWQALKVVEKELEFAKNVEPHAGLDYRCLDEIEQAIKSVNSAMNKISFGGTN